MSGRRVKPDWGPIKRIENVTVMASKYHIMATDFEKKILDDTNILLKTVMKFFIPILKKDLRVGEKTTPNLSK